MGVSQGFAGQEASSCPTNCAAAHDVALRIVEGTSVPKKRSTKKKDKKRKRKYRRQDQHVIARMLVWALVIGLLVMLVFIGLVYYDQYKQKQRRGQPDEAATMLWDRPVRSARA